MQKISGSQDHHVTKELQGYLLDLETTEDEQRRAYIRARADGAVNMALACQILDRDQAAEWQNKYIAAIFQTKGRKGNGRAKSDPDRSTHRPVKDQA